MLRHSGRTAFFFYHRLSQINKRKKKEKPSFSLFYGTETIQPDQLLPMGIEFILGRMYPTGATRNTDYVKKKKT